MTEQKSAQKKEGYDLQIFPVPFSLEEAKENINIITNSSSKKLQTSLEGKLNQAFKYHLKGNIAEAKKSYLFCINKGLKDPRIFSNYGTILKEEGDLPAAETYFHKAIKIRPNFAEAHCNLGNLLRELDKLEEAEIFTRKAIKINPNYAIANYNLGNILKDLERIEEAENFTRKAIKIDPNFAEAYFSLGSIYIDKAIKLEDNSKFKIAKDYIYKAIKLKPNLHDAHIQIGAINLELGELKEAELSILKAIEIKPNIAISYLNLGNIYRKKGNLKKAEILYLKAINIDPSSSTYHKDLGINFIHRENFKAALQCLETAHNLSPEDKTTNLLKYFIEKINKNQINTSKLQYINEHQGLSNNPLIFKREVENKLINCLYEIQNITHIRGGDPSFGDTKGSTYNLLDNDSKIIQVFKKDLIKLLKNSLEKDIFISSSFSTIIGTSGGGLNKHNHINNNLDKIPFLNLAKQKFSLVYYLSIGDQNCTEPGFIKFYNPDKKVLPSEGMIITFPADRYHSVAYNGSKVRVAIVVNYYAL